MIRVLIHNGPSLHATHWGSGRAVRKSAHVVCSEEHGAYLADERMQTWSVTLGDYFGKKECELCGEEPPERPVSGDTEVILPASLWPGAEFVN